MKAKHLNESLFKGRQLTVEPKRKNIRGNHTKGFPCFSFYNFTNAFCNLSDLPIGPILIFSSDSQIVTCDVEHRIYRPGS